MKRALRWQLLSLLAARHRCSAFGNARSRIQIHSTSTAQRKSPTSTTRLHLWANDPIDDRSDGPDAIITRRSLLSAGLAPSLLALPLSLASPPAALADFAPGGTLLDREVSIAYGNPEASPSRRSDNSNVLFSQDNYYKFGAAAPWIEPGSVEFPKSMPFVRTQQRYDALKKYGARADAARDLIGTIGGAKSAGDVPDRTDPAYNLRALGLLANAFLASENTGTTNELMLARWYVNEMYLRIGDYRDALERGDGGEAKKAYACLVKGTNSYLTLLNRSITSKVGDPFGYL